MINWILEKIAKKVYDMANDGYDEAYHREITRVQRDTLVSEIEKELKKVLSFKGNNASGRPLEWRDSVQKQIKDAIFSKFCDELKKKVDDHLSSEDFIDSIIERINRKQLRGK